MSILSNYRQQRPGALSTFSTLNPRFLQRHISRRRRPKPIQTNHITLRPDISIPTLPHTRFNREPRRHRRRQNLIAILLRLLLKQFPHGIETTRAATPSSCNFSALQAPATLPNRSRSESVSASRRFHPVQHQPEHNHHVAIHPPQQTLAIDHRHFLSRQRQRRRRVTPQDRNAPRFTHLRRNPPDESQTRCGIARNAARCSIG